MKGGSASWRGGGRQEESVNRSVGTADFLAQLETENRKLAEELQNTLAYKASVQSRSAESAKNAVKSPGAEAKKVDVRYAHNPMDKLRRKYVSNYKQNDGLLGRSAGAKEHKSPQISRSDRSKFLSVEDQAGKKCQSLRLRIAGLMKTVSRLEELNKAKGETISVLEGELRSKQRTIDSLQARLADDRSYSNIPLQPSAPPPNYRSKEKELEKRMQQLEAQLSRERKQTVRLTEMNSQLVAKVKGHEGELQAYTQDICRESELQMSSLQESLEETQRENERLQELCRRLQQRSDAAEMDKVVVEQKWREFRNTMLLFVEDAEAIHHSHSRLNSLLGACSHSH